MVLWEYVPLQHYFFELKCILCDRRDIAGATDHSDEKFSNWTHLCCDHNPRVADGVKPKLCEADLAG